MLCISAHRIRERWLVSAKEPVDVSQFALTDSVLNIFSSFISNIKQSIQIVYHIVRGNASLVASQPLSSSAAADLY